MIIHGERYESGLFPILLDMGISKNRGTPKWVVYNGKPY